MISPISTDFNAEDFKILDEPVVSLIANLPCIQISNDGFTVTYPGVDQSDIYNVLDRNPTSVIPPGITPVDNTTGALLQGSLFIKE